MSWLARDNIPHKREREKYFISKTYQKSNMIFSLPYTVYHRHCHSFDKKNILQPYGEFSSSLKLLAALIESYR